VILARYFDKQEYGTYKQIVFVYTTFVTLFTAGLPSAYAYFLPKLSKSEGKGIISRLTKLFLALGVLYGLCLFSLAGVIADALKNPELERGLKLPSENHMSWPYILRLRDWACWLLSPCR
jgi:O-antigen/teichoic acid export membrane protein